MLLRTAFAWSLLAGSLLAAPNIVVVLDDSGSMAEGMRGGGRMRKIDAAKQALRAVLAAAAEDSQIGVLALNAGSERDRWVLPLGPIDASRLNQALDQIRATGGTPLGECMKLAADALLEKRSEERYGDYRLLIVTDGEANDQGLVEAYLPDIKSRGIFVDVIGVDMRTDHSLATHVHGYRRADDPESLRRAMAAAMAEGDAASDAAGESDFELLAGFPDEVASEVISQMSGVSNEPIGTDLTDADYAEARRRVSSPGIPLPGKRGALGLVLGLFCAGVTFVLVTSLVLLLKAVIRR